MKTLAARFIVCFALTRRTSHPQYKTQSVSSPSRVQCDRSRNRLSRKEQRLEFQVLAGHVWMFITWNGAILVGEWGSIHSAYLCATGHVVLGDRHSASLHIYLIWNAINSGQYLVLFAFCLYLGRSIAKQENQMMWLAKLISISYSSWYWSAFLLCAGGHQPL